MEHFNPRTPLQSAIPRIFRVFVRNQISIHALRYRVRCLPIYYYGSTDLFQSTHSVTECDDPAQYGPLMTQIISIHALRYRVRSQDIVVQA